MALPDWLTAGEVATLAGGQPPPEPLLAAALAYATTRRPDIADGAPGADVVAGIVLLAQRLGARRGAVLGLVGVGDVVGTVARTDPDVSRLLGLGVHTMPAVG